MKATVKTIVISVSSLLAGYVLGGFLGIPSVSSRLGSGDVSKVSKYHANAVDSQASAFEEKILNDQEAQQDASITVAVLNSRVSDFLALVDRSIELASDKEELKEEIGQLATLKELSQNAATAGEIASASFDNLISGKAHENEISYEQAAQNLSLAYLLVEKNVNCGKQFVAALDRYFSNHPSEKNGELALLRDLWAQYCAVSAYLNNNSEELEYWNRQQNLLTDDQVAVIGKDVNTSDVDFSKKVMEKSQSAYADLVENYLNVAKIKPVKEVIQKHTEKAAQKEEKTNVLKNTDNYAMKTVLTVSKMYLSEVTIKKVTNAVEKNKTADNVVEGHVSNVVNDHIKNAVEDRIKNVVEDHIKNVVEDHIKNVVEGHMKNVVEGHISNAVNKKLNYN